MEEVITKVIALLTASHSATFKRIGWGPVNITAMSDLPAIYVEPNRSTFTGISTASDKVVHEFTIKVVIDLRSKFGDTTVETPAHKQLVTWIGDEDSTGKYYGSTSILKTLRSNISLGDKVLYHDNIEVNYPAPVEMNDWRLLMAEIRIATAEKTLLRS